MSVPAYYRPGRTICRTRYNTASKCSRWTFSSKLPEKQPVLRLISQERTPKRAVVIFPRGIYKEVRFYFIHRRIATVNGYGQSKDRLIAE